MIIVVTLSILLSFFLWLPLERATWKKWWQILAGPEVDLLLADIVALQAQIFCGEIARFSANRPYKFYSGLIQDYINLCLEIGQNPGLFLKTIRGALVLEKKHQQEIRRHYLQSILQMAGAAALTWMMVLSTAQAIDVHLPQLLILGIVVTHMIGLVSFGLCSVKLNRHYFSWAASSFGPLYYFLGLIEASVPVNMSSQRANLPQFFGAKGPQLEGAKSMLTFLIHHSLEDGLPLAEGVREILSELWHQHELCCELVQKKGGSLQFLCLALFFLSTYFVSILWMFSHFWRGL